ncbi:MAG: glycosyltransferase family 4 protein [Cyclobacteriaceae bacterium]|nr:glycosyltransferase family 4 protein [Cyclobacteriaceae bacterium]
MKVAIYSGTIPSTTFIERLIIGLAKQGIQVIIFGKLTSEVKYSDSNILIAGNRTGLLGVVQFVGRLSLLIIRHPSRFVRLKKYLGYGPFSGKIQFFNWQKYVVALLHLPEIFHIQWAKMISEWLFLKDLFGVKLVLSLRGTQINTSPLADTQLAELYRDNLKHYDAVHGVSWAIINEATRYGLNKDIARVIYSGLEYKELPIKSKSTNSELQILVVGRFHWKKGYNYLLDALFLLRERGLDFYLTLICQGELPEEILFQINELGLMPKVKWIKGLPYNEIEKNMYRHDLLILPSVEEGIANVILEAMQLGLPVVTTNCGGMSEFIENRWNGYLVPSRNPAALAEAIIEVQQLSDSDFQLLRQRAHDTIVKKFDMSKNIHEFISLYDVIQSG